MEQLIYYLNQLSQVPTSQAELPKYIGLCRQVMLLLDPHADNELKKLVHAPVYLQLAYALEMSNEGDRMANAHEAINLLTEVLTMWTFQSHPQQWADIHSTLADLYLTSAGDDSKKVMYAIEYIKQALWAYERVQQTSEWAFVNWKLARVYQYQFPGMKIDALEQCIYHYEQALTFFTGETYPKEAVSIFSELGKAYFARTQGNKAENIENAIECMEQGLVLTHELNEPAFVATLQSNLALAYLDRLRGIRAENVAMAGQYGLQALKIFSATRYPEQWAGVMVLLSRTSRHLKQGERSRNLEQAILLARQALGVYTREDFPEEWAMTTMNLAATYQERLLGNREQNLEVAIALYQQAALVYTLTGFPQQWADVQQNLAAIYFERPLGDVGENCDQAIRSARQALTYYDRDIHPYDWAMINNILGAAFARRHGGNLPESIRQAIFHYKQALTIFTRENYPDGWAMIQNNLGALYLFGIQEGQEDEQITLQAAITALEQSLTVTTIDVNPIDYRQAQRNLADIYFQSEEWERAVRAYAEALRASEMLYQESFTTEAHHAELRENRNWTVLSAYCLVKLRMWRTAVEVLEWGKARTLREELDLTDTELTKINPENRVEFKALRGKMLNLQAQLRQYPRHNHLAYVQLSLELEAVRSQLNDLIKDIQIEIPEFMPATLSFSSLMVVVNECQSPIIYLLVTSHGSLALLLLPGTDMVGHLWLEDFHQGDLHHILSGEIDYLRSIVQSEPRLTQQALDHIWNTLGDKLMRPVAEQVRAFGYEAAVLIPTGQLGLLPLHAFALEMVSFTLAPSVRALKSALEIAKERSKKSVTFLGIANPTTRQLPTLHFAQQEVTAVASLFDIASAVVLNGKRVTKAAVLSEENSYSYLHFACHGQFVVEEPLGSTLYLAGDDILTLRHILDGHLNFTNTRLVVLSACQTGMTEFKNVPDEAVGFPAGFLQVEVPAVISTLWAVDDLSTMLLMEQFYRLHLQQKLEMARALHQAQLWLREVTAQELTERFNKERMKSTDGWLTLSEASEHWRRFSAKEPESKPFSHPYYWAAFMFTGA